MCKSTHVCTNININMTIHTYVYIYKACMYTSMYMYMYVKIHVTGVVSMVGGRYSSLESFAPAGFGSRLHDSCSVLLGL